MREYQVHESRETRHGGETTFVYAADPMATADMYESRYGLAGRPQDLTECLPGECDVAIIATRYGALPQSETYWRWTG